MILVKICLLKPKIMFKIAKFYKINNNKKAKMNKIHKTIQKMNKI